MDDLEAIRQRKLQELRSRQAAAGGQDPAAAAAAAQQQAAEQAAALDRLLQQVLESEARERMERVRMSRPDLWLDVARQLAALAQQGRLARRLSDTELRQILGQLTAQDRDIKITRK
ncbi:MAG TPA: DNA-binding protein [Candidatus Thermoplasmatota archaeon]|nr:DNA-binding protein [Candidatus Thermoplasmatota archaeon]